MPTDPPHAVFHPVGWRRECASLKDAIGVLRHRLEIPEGLKTYERARWLRAKGYTVPGIASILSITETTVRHYLKAGAPPLHPAVARDRLWKHVLDPHLARQQVFNERDRAMMRARDAGATYVAISRMVGIIPSQVKFQIEKARRDLAYVTPVEDYFEQVLDLRKLAAPLVAVTLCPTCGRAMKVPVR